MFLLRLFLKKLIGTGTLTIVDAGGTAHKFSGSRPGPAVTIRLHDRWIPWWLFFNPTVAGGEAYMEGRLTIENATLYDFLDLVARNMRDADYGSAKSISTRLRRIVRPLQQFNPIARSKRNVAHHYDLSGALYDLFLDKDRQYSCAYFASGNDSLEVAQERKKRHIAAKLLVGPGQTVLDIGSGWGGLALYLAHQTGARVTGVTLSEEQLKASLQRARESGDGERVEFHLRDYRQQTGRFDRIVSVGMFEHVGVTHFHRFFGKVKSLLAEDGVALLHTIGRTDGPGVTDPWIRKYIFPGGYIPALSEIVAAIEHAGLVITDVEVLRLHYAETLRHWRKRFLANRTKVAALYDERFCRMWEFYLAGSEVSFRYLNTVVFQIQMACSLTAAPMTRDYMTDHDRTQPGHATYEDTRRSA